MIQEGAGVFFSSMQQERQGDSKSASRATTSHNTRHLSVEIATVYSDDSFGLRSAIPLKLANIMSRFWSPPCPFARACAFECSETKQERLGNP